MKLGKLIYKNCVGWMMNVQMPLYSVALCLIMLACTTTPEVDKQLDEEFFKNPPHEAKPKTWMHAMSGNMSHEGLTKDLESMASVGIGGLLLFNITQGIPNGPIKYNSKEHHELITHAAQEAERLGLSFGVHNCDGWSASGGPWVTPELSMKMVVWSEVVTDGGEVNLQMPQPTTREGLYKDIAVMAYPALPSEQKEVMVKITSSDPDFDIEKATDGRWDESTDIQMKGKSTPWIQYEYEKPQTIRSAFLIFADRHGEFELSVSNDGKAFSDGYKLHKVRTGKGEWAIADQFEPLSGRFFRLQLNQSMRIKEVKLSGTHTIDNLLGRIAMGRTEDGALEELAMPSPEMIVDKNEILDLSAHLDDSGKLQANLPDGRWTIIRFGFTSTGAFNNPASVEGKGLEVDKLSRTAFKVHYDAFLKKAINNSKPLAPNAFQYIEIDSYEMGGQNWTDNFDSIFMSRYGYDIKTFLPVIAGRFVDNANDTEAVLWDYRNLISDLMTHNYFGYFTELCHRDGLKSYIEPYGFGPLNDLEIGGKADIPMGEFWMNRPMTMVTSAVSSAHIYGKNIISAESFTSFPEINWKGHPAMAKLSGDKGWARGINEFMFHRFAHQANTHVEPGMTMNRWGFHFDRTQTWWENAGKAWFEYIARGSYLLRQGVPVSDLLVFIGDGSPNSVVERSEFQPALPMGINYDCVNADVLINRIKVKDGRLTLPEGTTYQALVLNNSKKLSLPTIKRLKELADQGVTIIGERPQILGGYHHSTQKLLEFEKLAKSLGTAIQATDSLNWNALFRKVELKKDLVIHGREDIDFAHRKLPGADIYFFYNPDSTRNTFEVSFRVQGKIPERWNPMNGEVVKLAQFRQEGDHTLVPITLEAEESVFVIFRESVTGIPHVSFKKMGIDDGHIAYHFDANNTIKAKISKNGHYSIEMNSGEKTIVEANEIPSPMKIPDRWNLSMKNEHEAIQLELDTLIDWKDHTNEQLRYFSGTGTYVTSFDLPVDLKREDLKIQLDLGEVSIAAVVWINGIEKGTLWMPPFSIDIADVVKAGVNELKIEVTNQWSNKLIGDERFPANDGGYKLGPHGQTNLTMPDWYVKNEPLPTGQRTTFTTAPFYTASDDLMPSGLKGPVQLIFHLEQTISSTQHGKQKK